MDNQNYIDNRDVTRQLLFSLLFAGWKLESFSSHHLQLSKNGFIWSTDPFGVSTFELFEMHFLYGKHCQEKGII